MPERAGRREDEGREEGRDKQLMISDG